MGNLTFGLSRCVSGNYRKSFGIFLHQNWTSIWREWWCKLSHLSQIRVPPPSHNLWTTWSSRRECFDGLLKAKYSYMAKIDFGRYFVKYPTKWSPTLPHPLPQVAVNYFSPSLLIYLCDNLHFAENYYRLKTPSTRPVAAEVISTASCLQPARSVNSEIRRSPAVD